MISECSCCQLHEVASVHKSLFGDHLLGQLSIGMLERFYHSYFVDDNNVFLVAMNADKVIGFVLGGDGSRMNEAKARFLKRYYFSFALEIVVRPMAFKMLIRQYWQGRKQSCENKKLRVAPYRLLSIGVLPEYQGTGLSHKLLSSFEDVLRRRFMHSSECSFEYGLSVHKDNVKAIKFYYKEGFMNEAESDISLFLHKYLS